MGRPLKKQEFFGALGGAGQQIQCQAYVTGGANRTNGYIVKQKNRNQYKVTTSDGTEVCTLVDGTPAAGGQMSIKVIPPGGAGSGATAHAVMKVNSGTVVAAGTDYVVGDTLTVDGGTGTAAELDVATIKIVSLAINARGTGYVPADTITLAGGTATTRGVVTVATTRVVSATIAAAGTGGTPGAATVTGTTGTGTPFQASVTIGAGGDIESVDSISVAGSYTVNPTDITNEPVTGGGLSDAALNVVMGVNTITLTTAGVYTVGSVTFTQHATSGTGTGATFNTGVFGVNTVTVSVDGEYTVLPDITANPVTGGSGTGATLDLDIGLGSIVVDAGGSDYNDDAVDLTTAGASEEGTADATIVDGAISVVTVLTAGTGYTSVPDVSFPTNAGLVEYAKKITRHKVYTFSGNSYKWVLEGTELPDNTYAAIQSS